jgi:hypothetical protein
MRSPRLRVLVKSIGAGLGEILRVAHNTRPLLGKVAVDVYELTWVDVDGLHG